MVEQGEQNSSRPQRWSAKQKADPADKLGHDSALPYELDRPALLRALAEIRVQAPGAAILVPWAHTDFNFL